MNGETKAATSAEGVAWERLKELRAGEQHFNEMKSSCRTLASSWLLASFGAMGFLLTQNISAGLPVEVLILCVGLAGSTGLLLLWVLDLLVYHRLLDAYFVEAREIERAHPGLPQVRGRMIESQPGGQATNYQACFYAGAVTAPLAFGGALFSYWCRRFGPEYALLSAAVITCLIVALGLVVLRKSFNPALLKSRPR